MHSNMRVEVRGGRMWNVQGGTGCVRGRDEENGQMRYGGAWYTR